MKILDRVFVRDRIKGVHPKYQGFLAAANLVRMIIPKYLSAVHMDPSQKETLSNIFEPFYTAKEVGQGTGLGLSTVYGIVKQNNGFINAYSEPGQGTTFKLYLPRYTRDGQEDVKALQSELPRGRGETIVIVEDEPTVLKVAQRTLERR